MRFWLALVLALLSFWFEACGPVCTPQTVAYADLDPITHEVISIRQQTYTVCHPRFRQ